MAAYLKKEADTKMYRIYVCDSLRLKGEGKYISTRYSDMINPKAIDRRSPEEIADEVIRKIKE